jgi:hypothetical protein
MRTYQTLTVIGGIIGILLTLALIGIEGFLLGAGDVLLNASESLSTTETQRQQDVINRQEFEATRESIAPFLAGLALSFFMYIAVIPVVFVVKNNTKAVGIVLFGIGVITTAITNFWGIIPFALLLPAGIVALRHKHKQKQEDNEKEK